MQKQAEQIKTMFSGIARRYDFLNSFLSFRQDVRWRQKTVRLVAHYLAQLPNHLITLAPILDVCTGTAELALAFRRYFNNKSRVVGTDFALPMLHLARRKIQNKHRTNDLSITAADTLRLPFKDNSFAVCSIAFGLRNLVDFEKGIKEMVRILAPGGRLAILEFARPANKIFAGCYLFYFTRILPLLGNLISGTQHRAYSYLPDSVLSFPDRKKMVSLLAAGGLQKIKVYPMTGGIVNLYLGQK